MRSGLAVAAIAALSAAYASPILSDEFIAEVSSKASWTAGINERFLNATREDVQRLLGAKLDEGRDAVSKLARWEPASLVDLPASVSVLHANRLGTRCNLLHDGRNQWFALPLCLCARFRVWTKYRNEVN